MNMMPWLLGKYITVQGDGIIRVVFETTAFAMGLDSPNIHFVIHWKSPNDIEDYVQESGRSCRPHKL